MASAACVNNVGMLPEGFIDCTSYNPSSSSPYGWFSPRNSFSRDFVEEESNKSSSSSSKQKMLIKEEDDVEEDGVEDLEVVVGSVKNELLQKVGSYNNNNNNNKDFGFGNFEFRLEEDPVTMLAADELFSDGKLVPRQLNTMRNPVIVDSSTASSEEEEEIINSVPETAKAFRRMDISDSELYLFSPKAPRCSSRWKELLGLKRNNLNNQNPKTHDQNQNQKISSSSSSSSLKNGSLKHFLHRTNPKSLSQSLDSSLNLPLLGDSDSSDIVHLPNSLSSSSSSSASSSSNHDEHPRFSLDSDPKHMSQISLNRNPPRVRLTSKSRPPTGSSSSETIPKHHTSVRARSSMHRVSSSDQSSNQSIIGLTIDSPRMNSCGKIVFQSLERSSSSPSTFNGGPRVNHRGVERSYSANVRVTPVLNVPVCSLRGSSKSGGGGSVFGFFSTNTSTTANTQKRGDNNGSISIRNHHHHHTNRNRSSTATNSTTERN